jgi:hypothetical protein
MASFVSGRRGWSVRVDLRFFLSHQNANQLKCPSWFLAPFVLICLRMKYSTLSWLSMPFGFFAVPNSC